MRFTIRDLAFDFAILFIAAVAWYYTDRQAVREAIDAGIAAVLGN